MAVLPVLPVLLVLLALLVVGAGCAVAVRVGRTRFCSPSSAFPCLVRSAGRLGKPEPGRWPRRRWRAVWAHDVLLLQRGVLLPRVRALAVRMPEEGLRDTASREVRRLGDAPVVVQLRLDDDSLVEIATARVHRNDLVGPFLAAAIPGLPRGPRERPNLGR